MESAIADPGCRVSRLPLLTESERSELLLRWNQTQEDYPREACVQELFEAQVQRSPDAIAVEFQGQQLSYRELNARTNQLARHLAKRGVGPEVLVGICLDPSADLLVAMLGVLKAGGAYVPLDRAHPPQRRVEILTESGAQFLITHHEALREMKLPNSTAIVRMDSDWPAIAAESGEKPLHTARANNLAYVIYTSGSTGRPKGVQIEHRGVVNFLCAMRSRPGITAADVVLAITTISFDPSVLELLLPLTVGARIVIPTREEVTDARRLLEVLERSAATILQATPTTWQLLLAAGWQGSPQMTALCGGEPLSRRLADQLLQRCASVWNIYGPTETTVWSVLHELDRADVGPPCIGIPIANMRMYVLDRHQQPVPLGVAGELYIGGDGMSRGYLGAEHLTAEKFIADPFSAESGARLYRSGDLVRRRPDGNLEYLARVDRQIKIRGHRIEPAEVESVLAQYPGVCRAAVVARDDGSGDKSLVAYVERHAAPSGADDLKRVDECCSEELAARDGQLGEQLVPALRRYLRQRLPDYMVPSAFVLLNRLPLTVSGKLDRGALPAPGSRTPDAVFVPPHDEVEARLGKIWEETLKLQAVGVTDDFFDLGGHSVLGARLLTQVEKAFGKSLPLSALFEAPTIERMAAILRQNEWSSPWLVQVQAGQPSKPPFFFVQARMGYRALASELGPDQPVYVVPYDNSYEEQTERSFREVAAELTAKIRELQPRGPYYLGGVCLAGWVAFSIARELYRQGEEVALLAIFDTIVPGHSAKRFQAARLGFLGERLKWHIQNFRRGDARQKYAYVVDSLRALRWRLNNKLWWTGHDFFRWLGRPLPRVLRQPARLTFKAALAEGPIGDYPGAVTLFRARERPKGRYHDPTAGWDKIAAGGLQVFEVPGDHKHLLVPPNVSAVARQLKVCLESAQVPNSP